MAVIGAIDVVLGVQTSAFNQKLKESSKQLQETFGLDAKSASSVAALEIKLRKQAETFGMTSDEAAIYKLKVAGVSDAALKTARDLAKLNQKLKDQADAQAELERTGSPILNLGKNIAVGLAGITTAAAGAAVGLAAFAKSSIDAMDAAGDEAGRIGIGVEAYTSLSHAIKLTGSEVEDLGPSLQKMNSLLGDAARTGAGPTVDALKRLGLSAKDLVNLSPDEAFRAIHDGFQNIKNPADQASIAIDVFGKSGVKLLNTLKSSPEDIEKLVQESKKLGIAFTDADAQMAGAANDSIDRVLAAFGGLGNKLAIGVAPVVTSLGESFLEWATTSVDSGKLVTTSLGVVQKGIGYVADVVNSLGIMWHTTYAGILKAGAVLVSSLSILGESIEDVINIIPGMNVSFTGFTTEAAKSLHQLAGTEWDAAKKAFDTQPSNGISKWFDGIKTAASEAGKEINKTAEETRKASGDSLGLASAFNDLRDKLKEKVDLFGLSAEQIEIKKFKDMGGSEDQIKELSGLQSQVKGKEDLKKLKDDSKSLIESLQTPIEKAAKQMKELDKLKNAGLITSAQYDKGKTEAFKGVSDNTPKFAGALDVGSQEARSALLAFNGTGGKQDAMKATEKNTAEANTYLKAIAANFTNVSRRPMDELIRI